MSEFILCQKDLLQFKTHCSNIMRLSLEGQKPIRSEIFLSPPNSLLLTIIPEGIVAYERISKGQVLPIRDGDRVKSLRAKILNTMDELRQNKKYAMPQIRQKPVQWGNQASFFQLTLFLGNPNVKRGHKTYVEQQIDFALAGSRKFAEGLYREIAPARLFGTGIYRDEFASSFQAALKESIYKSVQAYNKTPRGRIHGWKIKLG